MHNALMHHKGHPLDLGLDYSVATVCHCVVWARPEIPWCHERGAVVHNVKLQVYRRYSTV